MAIERGQLTGSLPIVPIEVLKKHNVHHKPDTRFRAAARLLQALWRERQGLPCAVRQDSSGRRRRIGSMLSLPAADTGRNFMGSAVAHLVRREVTYREPGALIEQSRLYGNLLSSMPLAFNAFGPLCFDLALAGNVLRALLPERNIAAVRKVWFEHSPGRGDPSLTGDRSAFDVAIIYERGDGAVGFVGIEAKYSEGMNEPVPFELSARYDLLASASGMFQDPDAAALRVNPCQQLFREHLLAQAALMRGDYAEATFVLLAPRDNRPVQQAATGYSALLTEPGDGQVPFLNVEFETYLEALYAAGAHDEALALFDRYLDWYQVDSLVEQALLAKNGEWRASPPGGAPLRLAAPLA